MRAAGAATESDPKGALCCMQPESCALGMSNVQRRQMQMNSDNILFEMLSCVSKCVGSDDEAVRRLSQNVGQA